MGQRAELGVRRPRRVGTDAARVHLRRVARAAHAADLDPRLRRAAARRSVPGPEKEPLAPVARIEHEAARMGGLVDNLLSLARLDEGRPLELADVDLTHARRGRRQRRSRRRARSADLAHRATPVHIVGDETALRQVLANLLSNAREHTPPGTTVEVHVAATTDGARLDVVDDGAGLRRERASASVRSILAGREPHKVHGTAAGSASRSWPQLPRRTVGARGQLPSDNQLARCPFRRRAARPTARLTARTRGRFGGLFSQVRCNFKGCHAQVDLVLLTE